jgi:hypothetical protein
VLVGEVDGDRDGDRGVDARIAQCWTDESTHRPHIFLLLPRLSHRPSYVLYRRQGDRQGRLHEEHRFQASSIPLQFLLLSFPFPFPYLFPLFAVVTAVLLAASSVIGFRLKRTLELIFVSALFFTPTEYRSAHTKFVEEMLILVEKEDK